MPCKNKLLLLLIVSVVILLPQRGIAQGALDVFGQLKSETQNLKNADIKIKQNNGSFQSLNFKKNGKFELSLPLGHIYTLEFSQNGCISKQIEISTICPEAYNETIFDPFYFSVHLELYSQTPSIDTLFYDRPVGKVYFSETYSQFGYDREYILFVQNRIREAVEQKLMASIKREKEAEKLLASNNILKNIDTLLALDEIELAAIKLDSVTASEAIAEIITVQDTSQLLAYNDNETKSDSFDKKLALANSTEANSKTISSKTQETPTLIEPELVNPPSPVKTEITRPIAIAKENNQESIAMAEPERKVRPTEQLIMEEPERKVRPSLKNTTTIPQFKTRPERKTFENTGYEEGLWTRIFINDGSRVTKYTMIQYNSGKTSYYKQDQYQTDSLQISRSIFMRVIK